MIENEVCNPLLLYCGCFPFQVDLVQESDAHMNQLTILNPKLYDALKEWVHLPWQGHGKWNNDF